MALITFTKANFEEEALNADLPVMVDFWAPWCGPCRMVSPIIDEIAEETAGIARVGKVNVDEEPELAQTFGVMSIPTVVVLKGGQVVAKAVGARPKQAFLDMLK
ncbi:MAG: thioredoxin [Ruminococcaceae bacterium]|nr:thioredoxin [Oscillospiraceae bacterium]